MYCFLEVGKSALKEVTGAIWMKKEVPGMKIGELTRCQKRSKKILDFWIFAYSYQRI